MSVYHSINDFIKAKEKYRSQSGSIIEGIGYYHVKGELVPDEIYFQHNTKPVYQPSSPDNPDKQNVENDIVIRKDGRRRKT